MDLFTTLVRYEVGLWSAVDDALRSAGEVGAGTLVALDVVHRLGGGARVQDVSAAIGITVGAASKTVDRLERDGLVTRVANPSDRRSSLLHFTVEGEAAFHSAADVRAAVLDRVLDSAAAAQALDALRILLAKLEGAAAPPIVSTPSATRSTE